MDLSILLRTIKNRQDCKLYFNEFLLDFKFDDDHVDIQASISINGIVRKFDVERELDGAEDYEEMWDIMEEIVEELKYKVFNM